MARGEPDSDAVQPPAAYGSGSCTPSQTACRYSNNAPVGEVYLYPEVIKITLLMICMCGLTTFRRKPLFEESMFSHLPAFCCGTSILLMRLPLRLDAGRRPNHLHPRYAGRKQSSVLTLIKRGSQIRCVWCTLFWNTREKFAFILEKTRNIWEHWSCLSSSQVLLAVSPLYSLSSSFSPS